MNGADFWYNAKRILMTKKTIEYCCPHCGRSVKQSDLSDTENAYPFQCVHCDEDFYAFECPFIETMIG